MLVEGTDLSRKKRCFVLMPFSNDSSLNDFFYKKLKPCLERSDFICRRADISQDRNLDRPIIEGIYEADIIIADLTGNNGNVCYELGISHAIPKKVLMISQNLDNLLFDFKPYRVLQYNPDDFKEKEFLNEVKTILSDPATNLVTDYRPPNERDFVRDFAIDYIKDVYVHNFKPIIVFIDLDGTLFDSTEQRVRSSLKAFSRLFNKNDKEIKQLYNSIYKDHALYEDITGNNFRYNWLTTDIYRIAYYLDHQGAHGKNKLKDHQDYLKFCTYCVNSEMLTRVEKAHKAFIEEPFRPYPYAMKFLEGLQKLNFKLILVTEGEEAVQKWKLEQMGFESFFEACHIGVPFDNLWKLKEYILAVRPANDINIESFKIICREYKKMQDEQKNNFHKYTLQKVVENFKLESFHLAVIGDRYDVDLKPYEEIDEDILRIAFTPAKPYDNLYKNRTMEDIKGLKHQKIDKLYNPPRLVRSLSEAFDLLANPDTWNKLKPISLTSQESKNQVDSRKRITQLIKARNKIISSIDIDDQDGYQFVIYAEEVIKYLRRCEKNEGLMG